MRLGESEAGQEPGPHVGAACLLGAPEPLSQRLDLGEGVTNPAAHLVGQTGGGAGRPGGVSTLSYTGTLSWALVRSRNGPLQQPGPLFPREARKLNFRVKSDLCVLAMCWS